jgi:hypothetical protein
MDDEPIRVEVDEPGIPAIWPLSGNVEIMEDLPDGGARVRVHQKSGVRIGRISARTLASRDDWDVNLRVHMQRAIDVAEEQRAREARLQKFFDSWGRP